MKNKFFVKTIVVDQIQYTPELIAKEPIAKEPIAKEPIAKEPMETTCGAGTKLVNGICKIIISDEKKFCFLFWCW